MPTLSVFSVHSQPACPRADAKTRQDRFPPDVELPGACPVPPQLPAIEPGVLVNAVRLPPLSWRSATPVAMRPTSTPTPESRRRWLANFFRAAHSSSESLRAIRHESMDSARLLFLRDKPDPVLIHCVQRASNPPGRARFAAVDSASEPHDAARRQNQLRVPPPNPGPSVRSFDGCKRNRSSP